MAITVTIRIVGIQFLANVVLNKENATIRDVLEAARGGERDFNFTSAPDGSLFQASALLLKPTASISSGRIYEPGLYSLADNDVVGTNTVTTWQWYLIRDGKQVNQPNGVTEKFNLNSPIIQDNDTIIWRLVVVAAQATIRAQVSSFDNKAERTTVGIGDKPEEVEQGYTKTARPGGRTSYKVK
jgi:hypothetical protein